METNTPDGQAWFWTHEWQAGEQEADSEIAAGHGSFYGSVGELLAALTLSGRNRHDATIADQGGGEP